MNFNIFNEDPVFMTKNNFDFKKIEKDLLKTVYRSGVNSENNSLPPLGLNLQMDRGYYSPVDSNNSDQFHQWKLKNELDNNKKVIQVANKIYIPVAKVDIKIISDYNMMLNLMNRASWRKTSLTTADVAALAVNFTDICSAKLGIKLRVSETDFKIYGCVDGKTYKNEDWDMVVGLFTTFYFLIINYIMKDHCVIGDEINMLKENLNMMTLNYGMVSIIPQHLQKQAYKFRFLFCKIVELIMAEMLYPYINVQVSRVSGISVDSNEMRYISLYNKIKIILDNICGNQNEAYYFYRLKDVIGYVLHDEAVWSVLVRYSVRDNYFIKYSNNLIKDSSTNNADKFLIDLIKKTSEYILEAQNRKQQQISELRSKNPGARDSDLEDREHKNAYNIYNTFYTLLKTIEENSNKRSDGVEYRKYQEKNNNGKITKLFVTNEQAVPINQAYYSMIYNSIYQLNMKEPFMKTNTEIVDINKELGLEEEYNLTKITYNYGGYNIFNIDFYFDYNNSQTGPYIRYIEMSYEEPVVEDIEDLTKYNIGENKRKLDEIKKSEVDIGWTL